MRRKPKGTPLMTGSKTTTFTETAKDLRDQAADYVETVKPHVTAALASARDHVEDFVETTARPALSDASARAREMAEEAGHQAKTKGLPLVATGAAYAADKASAAKDFASEKADEISGKAEKRRRRRVKLFTLLGLGALAAIAGFVAKKSLGGQDAWQAPTATVPPAPNDGPVAEPQTPDSDLGEPTKTQGDPLTDPLN